MSRWMILAYLRLYLKNLTGKRVQAVMGYNESMVSGCTNIYINIFCCITDAVVFIMPLPALLMDVF